MIVMSCARAVLQSSVRRVQVMMDLAVEDSSRGNGVVVRLEANDA